MSYHQMGYRPPQTPPLKKRRVSERTGHASMPSEGPVLETTYASAPMPSAPRPATDAIRKAGAREQVKQQKQRAAGRAPEHPGPKRRRRKVPPLAIIFSVLLLAVIGLTVFTFFSDPGRSDLFFEGVYIGEFHVGGMTREQATAALESQEQQVVAQWQLSLRCETPTAAGAEQGSVMQTITAQDIGLHVELTGQIDDAWKVGRTGSLNERKRTVNALKHEPYHATGGVQYDPARLTQILNEMRDSVSSDPVDATAAFTPEEEQPFAFVDEIPGLSLDVEALQAQIEQYIVSLQSTEIEVQPVLIAPKVTRAALQANLTCIVVVNTNISYRSEAGRNENIRIALGRLNGLMVLPDERVSFNKIVGRRNNPNNNYQEALEIAYGEYVTGIGGGVCQVSTTLYQAVLRAGLKIEERKAHAIPSDYADKGQDATVSDNGADFVFRNNTEYPIYIRARMTEGTDRNKTKRCEVSVYGRALPDGARYVLESRQIGGDIQPDPEKELIQDKKQQYVRYVDEQKEVAPKRVGYNVEVFLVEVRSDNMEVSRTKIGEDLYKPRPAQVYVGTLQRD